MCIRVHICISELRSSLAITLYFMVRFLVLDSFIAQLIGSIDSGGPVALSTLKSWNYSVLSHVSHCISFPYPSLSVNVVIAFMLFVSAYVRAPAGVFVSIWICVYVRMCMPVRM